MAISGGHVDYIWNKPKSRIGGLTYDPDLEAGRHKFLTWILAWRSWGIVAMNPRRLRQGDLWVQGHLGQSKSQIQAWWHTPLIWATPSAGDLHKDIGKKNSFFFVCLHLLPAHLLQSTSTEDQLKQLASWDWATTRFLDFQLTADHHWEIGLQIVSHYNKFPQYRETFLTFCDSR